METRDDQTARQVRAVSLRLWLGARVGGGVVGALIVWGLFSLNPKQISREPPTIQAVTLAQQEPVTRPKSAAPPEPIKSNPPILRTVTPTTPKAWSNLPPPLARSQPRTPALGPLRVLRTPATAQRNNAGADVDRGGRTTSGMRASEPTAPNIAKATTASAGATATSTGLGQGGAAAGRLSSNTLAIIRARECAKLDARDRPADCPPNDELARPLAHERGPQYRPENAEAFSRNEQNWRGIPPPCLEDGENAKVKGAGGCLRFGNTPSRVRSPREICEAVGLGGCADTPGQATVNSAIQQGRQQKAAKTRQ